MKGKNNPNWKGGRTKHSKGYVCIYVPDHPRASNNYVLEHILVAEKKLGRSLGPDEVCHHVNGQKDDNRPENIQVMTTAEHGLLHERNKQDLGFYDGPHSLTYQYLLDKYGLTISFQDAAAELGVYWENLRKLCKRGDIRAQKVGRSWMLTTRALADFIDYGPERPAPIPGKRERILSI